MEDTKDLHQIQRKYNFLSCSPIPDIGELKYFAHINRGFVDPHFKDGEFSFKYHQSVSAYKGKVS